jgi:hypothetical protein
MSLHLIAVSDLECGNGFRVFGLRNRRGDRKKDDETDHDYLEWNHFVKHKITPLNGFSYANVIWPSLLAILRPFYQISSKCKSFWGNQ